MPKVKGPLFSLSASGTFREILVYRTAGEATTVAQPHQTQAPRSPAQQQQTARFQAAVAGWRELTLEDREDWKTAASSSPLSGYQLYLREYQIQNITPPDQPNIP